MRSPKLSKAVAVFLFGLCLPISVTANESCDRLVKDLDKLDCAALDARMQSFLEQNKNNIVSLPKLAALERKEETQSYRKAFEKAAATVTKCETGQPKEVDAKLTTIGTDPRHIAGFYVRVNATLDYIIQTATTEQYVFEQLGRSIDELQAAHQKAGKSRKTAYN